MLTIGEIHKGVLDKIKREGAILGIEFYKQHEGDYNKISGENPKNRAENPQLRKKLEIIAAIEKKENILGISIQPKRDSSLESIWNPSGFVRLTTEDCVNYVIEAYYSGLKLIARKDELYCPGYCPPN